MIPNPVIDFGSSPGGNPPRRASACIIGCGVPSNLRTAGVGAKLASAREPRDDDASQHAEDDLGDDHRDEIAGPAAALGTKYDAVDEKRNHARQKYDEGIDHALDQRQRHHVPVGDVRKLMAQYRFDFFARHRASNPVDTDTSAELRNAPVANAFGSPS